MKILGINGSPRGKNSRTLKLVSAVLDGAKERGAETELVDIRRIGHTVLSRVSGLLRRRRVRSGGRSL